MSGFQHGISEKFIAALKNLNESQGWWRDVLLDNSLIIAVRKDCLHVYWHGQRIFEIKMQSGGAIVAYTIQNICLIPI